MIKFLSLDEVLALHERLIDRFGGKMQNAYPYSAKSAEGMKKLMDFLWVKTPLGRWLS